MVTAEGVEVAEVTTVLELVVDPVRAEVWVHPSAIRKARRTRYVARRFMTSLVHGLLIAYAWAVRTR